MKIEARKTMTAPNSHCALDCCDKKLPDAFGFLLWDDHPEDERFCSPECATAQFKICERRIVKKPIDELMPGIKKLLDSGFIQPTKTESEPFDSVECEVKTGADWLLSYWWWKDKSWWLSEKLWKALVEPVVIEYLRNNDPEKADDPLYLDGVMAEFDFKALDTKLIELLQFADEEQERNAGLTKTEGE